MTPIRDAAPARDVPPGTTAGAARPDAVEISRGSGRRDGDREESRKKLAASVARRIEDDIIRAGWPVGTVLGSEAALLERYKVSRAVFREAVRIVEHHHVAAMRRGPGGGLIVCEPDASAAAVALFTYLEYTSATVGDIIEARLIVEPLAAALAARHIDETGIASLRDVVQSQEASRPAVLSTERHRLHVAIAEVSGNPALRLFVETLTWLTSQYAASPLRRPNAEVAPVLDASDAAHRAISEAVIAGDAARASHRMTRHLSALGEFLASASRAGHSTSTRLQREGAEGDAPRSSRKLAEIVALRIQREIARRGWPVGEVLGSEGDLRARYGVSRAVLREAVRLLEHHSVATMRRGPRGGLVVTAPEPGPVVEAVALYLDYAHIDLEQLHALREAVELGCLDVAISRLTPEGTERLRHAVDVVRSDRSHISVLAQRFHDEIAQLTGNPILAVFEEVLTTLVTHHTTEAPPELSATVGDPVDAVLSAHGSVLDAMVGGDQGLARHRMSRHLRALTPWYH